MPSLELRIAADLASGLLNKALDAFARLDITAAVAILKEDDLIEAMYEAALGQRSWDDATLQLMLQHATGVTDVRSRTHSRQCYQVE